MGQVSSKSVLNQDKHFFGLTPIEISKQIIESHDDYKKFIKNGSDVWKMPEPVNWNNYIYQIYGNLDKSKIIIYNPSPFHIIKPINDIHKCYICLENQNIDCKMNCCNQYLHYECAKLLEANNVCTICQKESIITIEVYYCKQSEQFIYKKL